MDANKTVTSLRAPKVLYAYRVVSTKDPSEHPAGKVLLMHENCGAPFWKPNRLRTDTFTFVQYMKCRFLGRVFAKTNRGKALAVNKLLRAAGYTRGFLPLPKIGAK